jgi:predicted membrane-bound spermidine synthase
LGIDIESVTIIVATFMLGLGIGAFAGGYISDRYPTRLLFVFAAFELGIGFFGAASVPLIRWVGEVIIDSSRPMVAFANFLLLVVPTSLMGATLPVLTTWIVRREGGVGVSIGRLYFTNTLGAAAGSLLIAMGVFRHVELSMAIAVAVTLNAVAAASAAMLATRFR